MGQRTAAKQALRARAPLGKTRPLRSSAKNHVIADEPLCLAVFATALGWFAAAGRGKVLEFLTAGHPSAASARTEALKCIQKWDLGALDAELDWCPELKKRLVEYAKGKRVQFDDIPLSLPKLTEFQSRVLKRTRKIGFGETLSYGELALQSGHPRAARGVGTVMSQNRFPVIIPCHRVIASQGKLGGYSGPQGVCLKEKLLILEISGRD